MTVIFRLTHKAGSKIKNTPGHKGMAEQAKLII